MKIILLILLIMVAARWFAFWRAADLSEIYNEKPIYFGHRGDRLNFPENTLVSYRSAIEKGFDGVELDVLMTKDGKLVCSHNFDLERQTTGTGFIDEMDYQELADVKAGIQFPEIQREPIPLFVDVIKALPKSAIINIEIKTRSICDLKTAITIARMIKNEQIPQRVIVSSFNPIAIRTVKVISKRIPTGYIYEKANHFKGVFIARPDCLNPETEFVTDQVIQFCRKRNMRINPWTVNNAPAADWLIQKDIDGIITDNPELVKRL